MPDISMCLNKTCPMRYACQRHPASGTEPSYSQAYMNFEWRFNDEREPVCDDVLPISVTDNRKRRND